MNFFGRIPEIIERKMEMEKWYTAYALANLAAGGVSILIPLFVLDLGGGVGDIGLLTAAGNLVGVPASITWGTLSDRWNSRKHFVVVGMLGVALTFILMGFIGSFPILLLLNTIYILFWVSSASVVTILIIEKEDRGKWEDKIGSFNLSSGLGWATGLLIGFIWTSLATLLVSGESVIRYLFVLLGLIALSGSILAFRWIPGDIQFERSKFRGRILEAGDMITERFRYLPIHLYYLLKPKRLLAVRDKFGSQLTTYTVASLFMFTGFSMFFIPLPAYFKTVIGLGNGTVYLLFIANSLASALFYRAAARLTRRTGPAQVLLSSLSVRIVLFPSIVLPFLFIHSSWIKLVVVSLLFVAIGASWATANVSSLVILSRLSPSTVKGQVFGTYNGVIGLSGVFGSLLGGYLAKYGGYFITFLMASLFVSIGLSIIRKKVSDQLPAI